MSSVATGRGASALDWAEQAHALVESRPRHALALAARAQAAAADESDFEAEVAALHAIAWAQLFMGDARAASNAVRAGIRLADRHGDDRGAAILRRVLAASLALSGRTRAAQREIEAAVAQLSGLEGARSQVHRLAMYRGAGVADPGLERKILSDAARGLQVLRRAGDAIWEARLLNNRGSLYFDRGDLERAASDFRRASSIWTRLGADAAAADAALALAEVALLRGELLTCLKVMEEVRGVLQPGPLSNLGRLRVLALTQARLLPEARAAAEEYVALCVRTGRGDYVAAGLLDLAGIALMARDPVGARTFASRAVRSFAAHGKLASAALARAAQLRARLLEETVTRSSLRSGLDAAALLEEVGWRRDALRIRLTAARVALDLGAHEVARRELELARPLGPRGTTVDRIELCHAEALFELAAGHAGVAERLLGRGMRLLDGYQAALGAIELRAAASAIGAELPRLGLRLALESRRPAKVLAWAERLRANALRLPPVRPPADKRLGELQTELRRASAAGRTTDQARLEAAIRSRARIVEAAGGSPASLPGPRAAVRLLGGRVLVEYIELDGDLHALTLANGRLALHHLGAAGAATELEWLRFAYRRLAAGRMSAAQRAAGQANADTAATTLDELLVQPLLPTIRDAPLVLVPTGALHALPWGALASHRGRPLEVAPSLTIWCELAARPRTRRRKTVLAAGPRLRHAAREVRELGALRPGATVLHGKAADAEGTLAALDGAALAHLACHGRFRADSPLFSSLELADGPLNVYELQRLPHAPELVVLSACDLALSALHPGDELLGFAAALLGMGTRTIVASVVPVPDAAARRLMLAFHRDLLAGAAPAAALARAQAGAKTAGFICFGAG
jgi:tetratricopeptide (TPR) repeat protein